MTSSSGTDESDTDESSTDEEYSAPKSHLKLAAQPTKKHQPEPKFKPIGPDSGIIDSSRLKSEYVLT